MNIKNESLALSKNGDDSSNQKLPLKRSGEFLDFVDRNSLAKLLVFGILAYVGIVLVISVIEIVTYYCFGTSLVKNSNDEPAEWLDIFYFNFVTILTVGYGDIQPDGFGKILSTIEALLGVGLFAGLISLLTIKALRPSPKTIVFSKYAYYCLREQRFLIIFVNTSLARLESCTISSYFKIGRDWEVRPAITSPFITTAVQTFLIDEHSETDIQKKLTEGDCLRICVSGNLLGSEIAASVQYKPDKILVIENRDYLTDYNGFWHPNFQDPEFIKMFHCRPKHSKSLVEHAKPK